MGTNKNALIRYKVLDNCFRNKGKQYFIEDLINECEKALDEIYNNSGGISRRQIFDDISFMESEEGWSIELEKKRVGKKVFYRYAEKNFSINNMPLTEIEINQLHSAMNVLSQFKGMPQFEWIHELLPKLKQGISTEQNHSVIIAFDSNDYLKGIDNLGIIYNGIFYKKVFKISYQPFENEVPIDFIIHPYYLKQYNNRWFLFGLNEENNKYDWNLALDRIVAIHETQKKYEENKIIDWSEYFEDIIGVTKPIGASVEKVKLHFYGKTSKYIESKPIHGSQKPEWISKDVLEVNLQLIINYEFERFLLSYADNVKVISPSILVESIKNRLRAATEINK
jgi:predicted DNA-binding transcriptional regulator YafY